MVNYVNRFIPNFSSITEPLRQLVRKDNLFHWDKEQETSFQSLKSCLLRAPVLQLFSTKKHITIYCDSSKDGCGSVLLQDNKPVAYASKAFTQTQKNYAQIEKELLAILYACTKFHYFIFGRSMNDVTIETDHKPLISIFKKPLIEAPARLQRMLIMLQPYSFRLIYKKGKELYFADTLSRAYQNNIDVQFENKCNEIEFHLCSIVENIPMTKDKFELFKTETLKDDHLMGLKNLIERGFPSSKTLVPEEFKKYWSYRDQLAYGQDLLFKNNRIFVPLSLRKEMLKRIHLAHLGRDKTKLHARQFLFWPSMNQDIDNLIESCDICLSNSRENSKEPLEPHEILVGPWKKIGCDLFMFKNKKFLILVDYFSKFVEIKEIENETSNQIINSMYKIFSSYGIPEIVVSDGGPCFSAENFEKFSRDWQFRHIFSSPHNPQSNGQVERFVQTTKNIIKKSILSGSNLYLCLLDLRNTPISNNLPSPSQLMFGRILRSNIPVYGKVLKPKIQNYKSVATELRNRQLKQKFYYDRGSRSLSELNRGDIVKVKNFGTGMKWNEGKVIGKIGFRRYKVKLNTGNILIRNRKFLIKVKSNSFPNTLEKYSRFRYDDVNLEIKDYEETDENYNTDERDQDDDCIIVQQRTRAGRIVKPPERFQIS